VTSAKRIAAAALLGGTTSALTGGKFANGAISGAFSRAFNDENNHRKEYEKYVVNDEAYADLKAEISITADDVIKVALDQEGITVSRLRSYENFELEINSNNEASVSIAGEDISLSLSTYHVAKFQDFMIEKDLEFVTIAGGFNRQGNFKLSASFGFERPWFGLRPSFGVSLEVDPVGLVLSNFKLAARYFHMDKTRQGLCNQGQKGYCN
jgi:hypothetical protein